MAQLNDLIVTGNSRFINKTYTSTADVGCVTASSAAGATEHNAGTTGQALVSDGDSVYWGDPQHADTTDEAQHATSADEAQHATSAAALDDTEFIEDNEPYLFRKTPSEAGNRVYEDAIIGGSVVWNQLVQNGDFASTTGWGPSSELSIIALNHELTISIDNDSSGLLRVQQTGLPATIENHIYFQKVDAKSSGTNIMRMYCPANNSTPLFNLTTSYQTCYVIVKATQSQTVVQPFRLNTTDTKPVGSTYTIKNCMFVDLTQMFANNPAIAEYAYSLEQASTGSGIVWLKSYGFFTKDYYPYNSDEIMSTKAFGKRVIGFNQWNEQWEVGTFNNDTGEKEPFLSYWRSKNPIKVLPNTVYYAFTSGDNIYRFYYDKVGNFIGAQIGIINTTFTTPNNAYYLNIVDVTRNVYDSETKPVCINFYLDSEKNGEYEPYQEYEYDLSGERKVTRNYNIITFDGSEDENWTLFTTGGLNQLYATVPNVMSSANGIMTLCNKFKSISINDRYDNYNTCYTASTSICFNVENYTVETWRQWLSSNPVTVVYKIKEPYEETVTNPELYGIYKLDANNKLYCDGDICNDFVSPQWVSNWGTEEFIDERDVPIPVGHNSRYPKNDNYKLANIPAPPSRAGDYIVYTDEYGESVYQQASDIKVNYAGTADLGKRRIFIQGSQTTATTTGLWEGDASPYFYSADDLQDGQEITYWLPLPTTGSATLNLKFGDGTSSGAVKCYYSSTSRLSTHYGQGNAIHLTYRENVKIPSTGSTTYTGWWADANYYSDSNTVSSLRGDYTYLVAGANVGVQTNSLIARDSNGKYSSFTSNSTTAVSKIANRTDYFDISKIFYYSGSVAAGGNMASGALYWAAAGINSRYTVNASNLTVRKPLYLKFDANESTVSSITGATCYKLGGTANNDYWSQDLPASSDGMIYVEVSRGVRDYRVDLAEDQHYYQYTDKLHEYDSWNTKYSDITINVKGVGCVTTAFDTPSNEIIYSNALGVASTASGACSFATGINTEASGAYSITEGMSSIASGMAAHAEGLETLASEDGAHAEGGGTTASGGASHAEGHVTLATGYYNHAEGDNTTASGSTAAHAEGRMSLASGNNSHAEGYQTTAEGGSSHVEGYKTYTIAACGHAEGYATNASGSTAAHTEGRMTLASGTISHAEGNLTTASNNCSHSEGAQTVASGICSHSEGDHTTASGNYSHAEGAQTLAYNPYSHAGGYYTIANSNAQTAIGKFNATVGSALFIIGNGSSAEDTDIVRSNAMYITTAGSIAGGDNSTASGSYSFAWGSNVIASSAAAHAEGYKTTASGKYSHAEGDRTTATTTAAHAEGCLTTASGKYAHAEGYYTKASATAAHAEGYIAYATDDYAHAEGKDTLADAEAAHVEGNLSTANGLASHAEGYYCLASGENSHAEGSYSTASSDSSHAEGYSCIAFGTNACHAEGEGTTAAGPWTHAEGYCTSAGERSSHAEGYQTTAVGAFSHAGGYFTIANKSSQTAIGQCNATVSNALFIIGNGTATSSRSNAMYVTTAGNVNCVSLTQTSDERLKENVNPLTTADKSILDVLEPKQFTLKADERHQLHYGFIAQDVERQINVLGFPTSSHSLIDIADNEDAYYSLNYTELIPLLVQKVKDLEQRIAQLENK